MYTEAFEKPFLEATRIFYAAESTNYMRETEVFLLFTLSCQNVTLQQVADYLRHVETRLHEEGERVLHYLDASTRKPLINVVEKQLLEAHIEPMLLKGKPFCHPSFLKDSKDLMA